MIKSYKDALKTPNFTAINKYNEVVKEHLLAQFGTAENMETCLKLMYNGLYADIISEHIDPEIEDIIHEIASMECGVAFYSHTAITKLMDIPEVDSPTGVFTRDLDNNSFIIVNVDTVNDREDLKSTLLHESRHLWQFSNGFMNPRISTGDIVWLSNRYKASDIAAVMDRYNTTTDIADKLRIYSELPWELDAMGYQFDNCEDFHNNKYEATIQEVANEIHSKWKAMGATISF